VNDIIPVRELIARIMAEAEETLRQLNGLATP
jgi:hypothetical protein